MVSVAGLMLAVGFASCGGSSIQTTIPANGGELCSPDRRICVEIPPQGIAEAQTFRLFAPSTDRPGAQLSEVWDLEAVDKEQFSFLKPAVVRVKIEAVDMTNVRDVTLLRVFTFRDGTWEVLGNFFFDRVRNELRGTTSLLRASEGKRAVSAFTVLGVDRLPDGGLPIETDAGPPFDSGVIIVPPVPDAGRDAGLGVDAGPADAGAIDAGVPDAGRIDAGQPLDAGVDAGQPGRDAGVDAGVPIDAGVDAGRPIDAGVDAGQPIDAGVAVDAGVDAGVPVDAGADAGELDAGELDAGAPDAGADGG
jgi:hypothetical protein